MGMRTARGITLVELLIASLVALVIGAAIFTFVMFSSSTIRKMTAQQLLAQESAMMNEMLARAMRNGHYLVAGTGKVAPQNDTNYVNYITIRSADTSIVASFAVSGTKMLMNVHTGTSEELTTFLWDKADTATHFKVYKNGTHAELYLRMFRPLGDDTLYITQTTGDSRCKN